MAGKSTLQATREQVKELEALAGSDVRGEADRARAILATLAGVRSPEIAAILRVTEGSVRQWRLWFREGGVEALRSTVAPGPSAERGEKAAAIAAELLAGPVENRKNWTLPRIADECALRGVPISPSRLSVVLKKTASLGADRATR